MCDSTPNAHIYLRHRAELEAVTQNALLTVEYTHEDAVAQMQADFPALGFEYLDSLIDPTPAE